MARPVADPLGHVIALLAGEPQDLRDHGDDQPARAPIEEPVDLGIERLEIDRLVVVVGSLDDRENTR